MNAFPPFIFDFKRFHFDFGASLGTATNSGIEFFRAASPVSLCLATTSLVPRSKERPPSIAGKSVSDCKR
jgi:hypothetical protein